MGNNYGKIAVEKAKEYLKNKGVNYLYLDFISDNLFLSKYYTELNFIFIKRKEIIFPKCGHTMMDLMKCEL